MSAKHWVIAAATAFCGYGVFQITTASAQPPKVAPKVASGEQEIRSAAAAFAAAFNKGDSDALLAFWADDADYVDDSGVAYKGKKAISELVRKNCPLCKGHTMSLDVSTVKFTRPDVALEEGVVTVKGPDEVGESNRYMAVWVKNNDRWQLSSVRDQTPPMESYKGDESLAELGWLVGDWIHENGDVKVALKCRWMLNKQFLVMEYDVKKPNEDPTEVAVWIGWDPGSKEIRSWVFDSEGGNSGAKWQRNGDAWSSKCEGVLGDGRSGSSVNSIQYLNDDAFVWRSKNRRIDGSPVADNEVKFSRRKEAAQDATKESNP